MDIQPFSKILESLCQQATDGEAPLIIDARIALMPEEARLLELKTSSPLATILF